MCMILFLLSRNKNHMCLLFRNGLENVKHIIEYRATTNNDAENVALEKKQYELLLSQ